MPKEVISKQVAQKISTVCPVCPSNSVITSLYKLGRHLISSGHNKNKTAARSNLQKTAQIESWERDNNKLTAIPHYVARYPSREEEWSEVRRRNGIAESEIPSRLKAVMPEGLLLDEDELGCLPDAQDGGDFATARDDNNATANEPYQSTQEVN